jgi:hypothetical protein
MSFLAGLLRRVKLEPRDAEVIFDRDEPIGHPTDVVMARRRWFRRSKDNHDERGGGIPSGTPSSAAS